jgi:hypothetical protein
VIRWESLLSIALQTCTDVLPIIAIIVIFQFVVLRAPPTHAKRIVRGGFHALLGLILFRFGLDSTLLPLGADMAQHLAGAAQSSRAPLISYLWLVLFAGGIGLAATLIEPTLLAIADRIQELTGGEIRAWDLRLVVACGVAMGLCIGTVRIILGTPILVFIVPMIALLLLVSFLAPKNIVSLALDTGPMATSVVTVPLIAAFGSSVARTLPGRDPVLDGFGLIFFALLTPVLSLLMFTTFKRLVSRKRLLSRKERKG